MASESSPSIANLLLVGVLYGVLAALILLGVDRWIREVIREEIPACRCERAK